MIDDDELRAQARVQIHQRYGYTGELLDFAVETMVGIVLKKRLGVLEDEFQKQMAGKIDGAHRHKPLQD